MQGHTWGCYLKKIGSLLTKAAGLDTPMLWSSEPFRMVSIYICNAFSGPLQGQMYVRLCFVAVALPEFYARMLFCKRG